MKLLYHYSYSFADAMSKDIVERVANKNIKSVNNFNKSKIKRKFEQTINKLNLNRIINKKKRLLSLGSILHIANDGDVIWGSGVIKNRFNQSKINKFQRFNLDIRAVRGPLSYQFAKNYLNQRPKDIYGDPALLIPTLFPEFKVNPIREFTIILQHLDEKYVIENNSPLLKWNEIFLCQRNSIKSWQEVLKRILESKFVISSSLHGIIFAESFGIPARWLYNKKLLPSSNNEGKFKYNDYLLSTNRSRNMYAKSIEEALYKGGMGEIKGFNSKKLIDAFPIEYFN